MIVNMAKLHKGQQLERRLGKAKKSGNISSIDGIYAYQFNHNYQPV